MKGKKQRLAKVFDRAGLLRGVNLWRQLRQTPGLNVLTYHSVGVPDAAYPFDPDVMDVSPASFRKQMRYVREHCSPVSLDDVCESLNGSALPPNSVLVTFDDGYKSCYTEALPTLQTFGVQAVFFIATYYVDERRIFWWDLINYVLKQTHVGSLSLRYPEALELDTSDRESAIQRLLTLVKRSFGIDVLRFTQELAESANVDLSAQKQRVLADELIMTWDEIRELHRAGMAVEAHTRTHRVLQTVPAAELEDELLVSKQRVEQELGATVRAIAYPNGDPVVEHPELCAAVRRAGYQVGFTNATGAPKRDPLGSPFDVNRLAMDPTDQMALFRARLALPVFG